MVYNKPIDITHLSVHKHYNSLLCTFKLMVSPLLTKLLDTL